MTPQDRVLGAAAGDGPARPVQVKICGLTRPDEAAACAELGASAIGCVFYERSPRCVAAAAAADIRRALPQTVALVGVFVDETVERIMDVAGRCRLTAVQLHGRETPGQVERLTAAGLSVIKALFAAKAPRLEDAPRYAAAAFLAECGLGVLPGGNALSWDWGRARSLGAGRPLILAGGLTPENVAAAAAAACPDAVDVSSGVESAPGRKDIARVKRFIQAARSAESRRRLFP